MLSNILFPIFGYLFGSISSAIIIAKIFQLPDPRSEGSNNPGATNILRLGGKLPAILTLLGDALKGFIPVIAAKSFNSPDIIVGLTGLLAFAGHCFPCFFGFKGGKGVATAIGVFFGFHVLSGISFLAIWLTMAFITKYSSLSALIAIALAPIYIFFITDKFWLSAFAILIGIYTFWRHKDNIQRLRQGTESKIGSKTKK